MPEVGFEEYKLSLTFLVSLLCPTYIVIATLQATIPRKSATTTITR